MMLLLCKSPLNNEIDEFTASLCNYINSESVNYGYRAVLSAIEGYIPVLVDCSNPIQQLIEFGVKEMQVIHL